MRKLQTRVEYIQRIVEIVETTDTCGIYPTYRRNRRKLRKRVEYIQRIIEIIENQDTCGI